MPRIHKPSPIDFLVERKHPELPFLRYPTAMTAHKLGNMTEQEKVNRLKEILAYREELKSKPPEEINRLYEIELAEHYKEIQLKAEKEEQKRFFHQPYSDADLEHWSKTAYWSLDEAIALSFGKDPEVVSWHKLKKFPLISPFAKDFKRTRDLALRAVDMKQLSDPVLPTTFLAWARGLELQIPDELANHVAKRHAGGHTDWKVAYDKLRVQFDELSKEHETLKTEVREVCASPQQNMITESPAWQHLYQVTEKALAEYKDWEKKQGKIQRTGNLMEWLQKDIGASQREADFIKKVISENFNLY